LENFALIDNNLAAAQRAIGGSSNLAQIALTYTYNFNDEKYQKYVCILSVLAQVAIDNAKRRFDIDLNEEIANIEKDMNLKKNGLPAFWSITKKDKRKCKNAKERQERRKKQKERIKARINKNLVCPMNYIFDINVGKFRSNESTLPMEYFFSTYEPPANRRKSKKVEELIQKYSLDLFNYNSGEDDEDEEYLLLRSDYDELVEDIKKTYISGNYRDLMSWLINRAFRIGSGVRRNKNEIQSTINTNKSLLLKVLYDVNRDVFLQCFQKNLHT